MKMYSKTTILLLCSLVWSCCVSNAQYCEPDAEIPDDLIRCGSCENRCGTVSQYKNINCLANIYLCSCDNSCGYHGDCCQDFHEFCPEEAEHFRSTSEQYPLQQTFRDFQCKSFHYEPPPSNSDDEYRTVSGEFQNLMIATCPDGSECEFTAALSEDVNTFVPMYDIHRGVHYISGQCAVCNGATDVMPWGVDLNCNPVFEPKDYVETGLVNSTDSLTDVRSTGACTLTYSRSGVARVCSTSPPTSTCSATCQNQNLRALCESDAQAVTFGFQGTYRNQYCALCNEEEAENLFCKYPRRCAGPGINFWPPGSFSLTLVFDFDPRKGLAVGQHPPPECATGEVYVPDEDACRPITCPSGFVLDGSNCIPEPSSIIVIVQGMLTMDLTSRILESAQLDKGQLDTTILPDVIKTLDEFNVTHNNPQVATQIDHTESSGVEITSNIRCNCDYSTVSADVKVTQEFKDALEAEVRKHVVSYLSKKNIFFQSVESNITLDGVNSTIYSRLADCTWLVYGENETIVENNTVVVSSTGRTYPSGMFQILDENTVIVCETDLSLPDGETSDIDLALGIVTVICVGISIICLIIRIVLQYFISSFKSRPGRLQFQLTIAFLIAFIMLIVGVFLSDFPDACTTAAIILAYGFLAAFIWMNIIAVDHWLVFRPSAAFLRSDEEDRSLIIHYLCGWGIPLLLVTISIGMNYSNVEERFIPEFGGPRCWYTQRYAMLLYFGIPIALSILINIVLYIWTSLNLRQAFKKATHLVQKERYHFAIYVRLFILMGITWIFGFISAFTDEPAIDFIFVILNSLQGLFLFISFVCNKRVLSEIKEKTKSETSVSTSGKQTKSTPLNSVTSDSSETKI